MGEMEFATLSDAEHRTGLRARPGALADIGDKNVLFSGSNYFSGREISGHMPLY